MYSTILSSVLAITTVLYVELLLQFMFNLERDHLERTRRLAL